MGKLGKLVVFAIILSLILGSFYYFNLSKSKEAEAKKSSLQVDQFLIKVLIREGSNLTAPLKVMNVGDKGLNVKAEAKNLGFLHISQPEFYLDYGQSIDLNLMFGTKRGAVAQEPGIYVGKLALISDEERKEVPIIVGVESGEILFSMNMNIPTESRRLAKGAHGFVTVTVYNLKKVGPAKVLMSYFISDTSGNKIITESESIVVEDKTTFTKTITAPENIIEGDYIFAAIAKYGSSTGVATSSFEVAGAPEDKLNFIEECSSKPYCLTLSVVVFIIIVSTLQYIYFTLELTRLIKPRLAKQKAKKKKEYGILRFVAYSDILLHGLYNYIASFYRLLRRLERLTALKIKESEQELHEEIINIKKEVVKEEKESKNYFRKIALEIKKKRLLRLEEKKRKLEEKREGKALRKEEEAKKQKELEAMQIKEERERAEEEIIQREQEKQEKVLERKRLAKVRKRRIKEFLHKLGLYKTEEDKKQKEKERQEKLKKEEEAKKQKGLERQGAEEERLKRTAELKRRKEIGAKRRGEERQKRRLKREKLLKSRKKQIKEFLHKLGLYKTEEEKRQIALQRERGKQERLRKEAEIRKQQELERKRAEEERKRKEEELRKQRELEEKQRQEEELKKQAEKVKKRQEELRKQEELRRQEELEKKKREIERQRQEQIKAKKLEQIKQAEVNINSNKEMVKLLNSKLSRMISEKKPLLSSISEIDAKLRLIADEIVGKSKRFEELSMQKSFIIEAHKKQVDELYKKQQSEKAANESKIKELKEGFAAKRDALIKDLEEELSKLTQSKREVTGKWKRLELKAKLKIEEQTLEEESKKYESRASDEGKRPEGDYKKALEEINKKQGELKQGISDLEGQKGQILREKGKISEDVQNKGSKIQKIRLRLENAAKEHAFLRSEWSKLKSELPRLNLDFFANVLSEFKDKAQNKLKGRKQKEQQRLAEERKKQLEAKKGNLEEEGRKQKEKEKEEKLRKEEGAKEQKELERRRYAIELKNQKELETKKRIEDERIKDEENKRKLEIKEKLAKERKKKFSEFFRKIGLYKTPEEKKQAALLKEKQRQEKRRLEQEDFRKKEEGKKQKEKEKEEKLRKEEEAKKQKGLERRRAEEHNKIEELEKEVKELERQRDEKRNLQEVEKEVPEKKTKWFEGLFKKKKAELEEAKEEAGEEPEEAEEGGVDKSENLGEFYKLLNGIKQAINGKDISKAKKLYKEAWEIYASLKYEEQKEVYGKFMKSYNQLSKK
ncbi:hypothetical protein J4234_06930 [Candidatus Woesearchaeota archaeon]|nr:hypothetical protein [Candidatus Woesearchaeota archaeon]